MKLLTPTQTKDSKETQNVREILRTQETQKAAEKSRKDMANAEADFRLTLARNREQWAKEEQEHTQRMTEMSSELKELEDKKTKALAPIELLKKQAEEKLQETTDYLAVLVKRDEETEKLNEALQDKLDRVGQQEQDLLTEKQQFEATKQGIEQQKQHTIQGAKQLSDDISNFNSVKQQAEKDIQERKTSVALLEAGLISKDKVLKDTQIELDKEIQNNRESLALLEKEKQEIQKALTLGIEANNSRKDALEKDRADFTEHLKEEESKLERRKTSIALIESSLISKDAVLKRKQMDLEQAQKQVQEQREKLAVKAKELEQKEQAAKDSLAETSNQKQEFIVWKTKAEKVVEDKAMANSVQLTTLEEKEKELEKQEKFLADWAAKLADQRTTLQRGFDELRKKQ